MNVFIIFNEHWFHRFFWRNVARMGLGMYCTVAACCLQCCIDLIGKKPKKCKPKQCKCSGKFPLVDVMCKSDTFICCCRGNVRAQSVCR